MHKASMVRRPTPRESNTLLRYKKKAMWYVRVRRMSFSATPVFGLRESPDAIKEEYRFYAMPLRVAVS